MQGPNQLKDLHQNLLYAGCLLEVEGPGGPGGGGGGGGGGRQLKTQNQQKNLSMFANHLHATLSLEIFLKSILNYMKFVKIGSSLGTYILHAQPPLIL